VPWKREESRKQKLPTKNSSFNKDKKPLNKPKQTPFPLISHNDSKTHGYPVHLQEG
jgi:hypothetical protein